MGEKLEVRCACGWATSGTEDEVVEATVDHGRRVHNMLPTREEVLAMAAATAAGAGGTASPDPAGPDAGS